MSQAVHLAPKTTIHENMTMLIAPHIRVVISDRSWLRFALGEI
jgi:hypothetical protein